MTHNLKNFLRRVKYRLSPTQRALRARQHQLLNETDFPKDRAIVFLVHGRDIVNGGVMAICSHAEESQHLYEVHRAGVHVCSMPGGATLLRFTQFVNSARITSLDLLLARLEGNAWVHINIPEVCLGEFLNCTRRLLGKHRGQKFSFNVMLQNIDLAPSKADVMALKMFGLVTVTTAHKAYSLLDGERLLGARTWHWSVWVSPEKYAFVPFERKKNLILYSPDTAAERDYVLAELKRRLPDYELRRIWGIKYEDYKALIGQAKFCITFGEGLDGYFVEPIFSGSIGCAVYNERFFTTEYKSLPCVYRNWKQLASELGTLIAEADAETLKTIQTSQFDVVAKNYSYSEYQANLRIYYSDLMALLRS